MRAYRHIIWDWNGTLLDDVEVCIEILNNMLAERGCPAVTPDQYAAGFGFPVSAFYESVGFDFNVETYQEIAHAFTELYDERRMVCRLRKGAFKAFHMFTEAGLPQSLLSAYQQQSLEEMAHHFKITGFFQTICGLDNNLAASKLENGRRLVSDIGCAPPEILLIGDTIHDAEVAQASGITCILLPSGHQSISRLTATGLPVMDDIFALLKHLQPKLHLD